MSLQTCDYCLTGPFVIWQLFGPEPLVGRAAGISLERVGDVYDPGADTASSGAQ